MHYKTLFVLKGTDLKHTSEEEIKKEFSKRFCNECGETTPKYFHYCDWFEIGGRWGDCNILITKKGQRNIVEIKDLTKDIDSYWIEYMFTKSRIYTQGTREYNDLLNKINSKKINGIVVFLDCHD